MTRLPQLFPPAPLRGDIPSAPLRDDVPSAPLRGDVPATTDRRWFDDGVRFRCLGPECGDCCSGKHGPGVVWLDRDEALRLASHLGLTADQLRRRYLRRLLGRTSLRERANHDCVFFRAGIGCTVYEARPLQCRTYPFWGRILASRVTWENEAEQCPGIDTGDTQVSGEEVSQQLALDAQRHAVKQDCASGEAPTPRSRRGTAR